MSEAPRSTYMEDEHFHVWDEAGIQIVFERFHEEGRDLKAYVRIESTTSTGFLPGEKLNLSSARSLKMYANTLDKRGFLDADEWFTMLAQAAQHSEARYREGAPPVDLWMDEVGESPKFLVEPLIVDSAMNLIYGNGDSGKSLLALTLALVIATGEDIAGLSTEQTGPVLLLDWEDGAGSHQQRLRGLSEALGLEPAPGAIIYRRMAASLREAQREVRKDVAKSNARLVIIDSMGMACGGDPNDPKAIIEAMVAARSLNIATLGIHHLAKGAKDKSTPYGSVYASLEARMTWHAESERQDNQLSMALTNWKSNLGARQPQQRFRFNFTENEYGQIHRIDVMSLSFGAAVRSGLGPAKWRVADYLKQQDGPRDRQQIVDSTGLSVNTVKSALSDNPDLFTSPTRGVWALKVLGDSEYHPRVTLGSGDTTPPLKGRESPTHSTRPSMTDEEEREERARLDSLAGL